MATSDGYGKRLGERLRVASAPVIVTRVLRKADIAVTGDLGQQPIAGNDHPSSAGRCLSGRVVTAGFSRIVNIGRMAGKRGMRRAGGRDCIHDLNAIRSFSSTSPITYCFFICRVQR